MSDVIISTAHECKNYNYEYKKLPKLELFNEEDT